MRRISIATIALLALAPLGGAVDAKSGKVHGSNSGCPPGLAKKNPPCVPPGLAKKGGTYQNDRHDWERRGWDYRVGDVIDRDYVILRRPEIYGLDPYSDYFRVGDYVYRVNRDTRAVLQIIGALAVLLD